MDAFKWKEIHPQVQKCCCENSISAAASWPQGMVASSSFARCLRPIWMANTWFLEVWLKAGHLPKLHHGLLDLAFLMVSGFSWFYASTEPKLDLPTNFADGFGHKPWCSPFASLGRERRPETVHVLNTFEHHWRSNDQHGAEVIMRSRSDIQFLHQCW